LPVHESEEVIPSCEVEIACESSQVIEKGSPCAENMTDGLVDLAGKMEHGVDEKCQQQ
jgi:hypothetical protein